MEGFRRYQNAIVIAPSSLLPLYSLAKEEVGIFDAISFETSFSLFSFDYDSGLVRWLKTSGFKVHEANNAAKTISFMENKHYKEKHLNSLEPYFVGAMEQGLLKKNPKRMIFEEHPILIVSPFPSISLSPFSSRLGELKNMAIGIETFEGLNGLIDKVGGLSFYKEEDPYPFLSDDERKELSLPSSKDCLILNSFFNALG
jgi:hypothetical protein